jgi:HNH endonuclease
MKRIRRPNVLLPTLQPTGIGGKEATRRETLFNTSHNLGDVNTEFTTYWGNADVRGALWAMHGRSCVYCDRELPGNDRGDVEHFRPKSIYWWLAYSFENYLLACSVCNSAYKGEKFPLLPHRKPYNFSMKAKLVKERRALIDPVADSTDGWFGIEVPADWKRQGFPITINSGIGRIENKRCEATRTFFRLNVDPELRKARLITVHVALNLIEKANAGDVASEEELRKKAVRFSPHSFAVRQAIMFKGRPDYLPSYEEEVEWLIDDLVEILQFALDALADEPGNTSEQNRRDRCAWALAVLMKDPPALSTEAIRTRLVAEGVLGIVEPFYNLI